MLRPFAVELARHDPAWDIRAGHEAARLRETLGAALIEVHHIGSTAIPSIVAKPIVDLMPVVTGLAAFDAAVPRIEALGLRVWGEYGIDGRRYCTIEDPSTGRREVQMHVFAVGSPHIARHLAFREFMRSHPDEARAYEAEKQRARALYPHDSHGYAAAKSDWVRAAERRAVAWYASPMLVLLASLCMLVGCAPRATTSVEARAPIEDIASSRDTEVAQAIDLVLR